MMAEPTPAIAERLGTLRKHDRRVWLIGLLAIGVSIGVTWATSSITEFNFETAALSFPKAFDWFANNFIPDQNAMDKLGNILVKLRDTFFISICATVVAAAFALVLALLGSKTTRVHAAVTIPIRLFASVCRNIPVVAWALAIMFAFGQSGIAGFIAIFIDSVGLLTRLFIDTIDEASESQVEALKATGATRPQYIVQAVLPSVLPQIVSWMLYMLETNIRSATLVGMLTGSGIGFLFNLYYNTSQFGAAALSILGIIIVVLVIEGISNALRRVIL